MVLGSLHGCLDLKLVISSHKILRILASHGLHAGVDDDAEQEVGQEHLIEATEEDCDPAFIVLVRSHLL